MCRNNACITVHTLYLQAQLLLDKAAKAGLKLNTYAYNACMAAHAKAADADGALALLETMQQLSSSTTTSTTDDDDDVTVVTAAATTAATAAAAVASAATAGAAAGVQQSASTVSSSSTELVAVAVARHSLFPPTAKVPSSPHQDPATSPSSASDVTPDIITYNLAMDACAKSGDYALALWLLSEVLSPARPALRADAITWGTAIAACARGGNPDAALALLQRMRLRGVSPCSQAYASAIGACKRAGRSKDVLALVDQVSQLCA
jgi:pentatricopeptide repeat protein